MNNWRGLSKHYDYDSATGEAKILLASIFYLSKRLTHQEPKAYINTFFQSGGTYLRLGRWVHLIVGERSQEEEDRSQEEGEER